MATNTMIATKISTKTKVAVGIAVVAGGLALANALIPLVTFRATITAPDNKATVSGTVTLVAQTSGPAASVGFSITPGKSKNPVIAATGDKARTTWQATWDTTSVPNGTYGIEAGAVDAKGKKAKSGSRKITVQNNATPPPTPTEVCGNGVCAATETTASCAADCPAPAPEPTPPNGTMSYSVSPDDTASEAGLVVLGGSGVVLAKFRLTAAGEELQQTKLRIAPAVAANATSIVSLSLYDGATLIAGPVAASAAGAFDFTGLTLTVPQDASKTLTVKAALNTVSGGAASGRDLQLKLHVPATDDGSFEYVGTTSAGIRRAQAGGDVSARQKISVKTRPTVMSSALPSMNLTAGTVVTSRFTVTADAAEQVSLKKVSFKMATTGLTANAAGDARIREVGQGSALVGSGKVLITGSDCGFAASVSQRCVHVTLDDETVISAGTSKTYELLITYSGSIASESVVSTNLLGDAAWKYGSVSSLNPSNFIWSDNAGIPHSGSSADWANGNHVKVLPSDPQTLVSP